MENNLTYTKNGDYMIPDLKIEVPEQPLGKYGRMRQKYLKEHRPILWNQMILEEALFPHLLEIEQAAQSRLEQMMPELAAEAGATEALKARNPMKWVGLMNTCKAQAEEVILAELISNMMQIPVSISAPAIIVAVVFSTFIGVVFGMLPAYKAANLNPIEALRRD